MTDELERSLQSLVDAGFEMAAVVAADGLVIASAQSGAVDVESVCAVGANGLLMLEAFVQELGSDSPATALLEIGDRVAMMQTVGSESLLITLTSAGTNLGRARLMLRNRTNTIAEALTAI